MSTARSNERLEDGTRFHINEWAKRVAARAGEIVVLCGVETGSIGLNVHGFAYTRLSAEEVHELWEQQLGEDDEMAVQKAAADETEIARFTMTVLRTGNSEHEDVVKTSDHVVEAGVHLCHYRSLIPEGVDDDTDFE